MGQLHISSARASRVGGGGSACENVPLHVLEISVIGWIVNFGYDIEIWLMW